MRFVPGVSIGDEGGTFWPWHRDRDEYFRIGHHRIGAAVVTTCRDCGTVLATRTGTKSRKSAGVKQHDDLHRQLSELHELVAGLYERLGFETGEQDSGDTTQNPEGGYIEPGYDVREAGTGPADPDSGDG